MATNPEVTVLTAVRNGSGHLQETIACIEAQTFTDWEYIIVDDASTDNTPELVEEAIQRNPRIRLLRRKTSSGPYVAANDGLREAKGTWVVRIDADDLSPSNRIERQRAFLLENRRQRGDAFRKKDSSCLIGGTGCGQPHRITPIPRTPGVFRWYLMLRGRDPLFPARNQYINRGN